MLRIFPYDTDGVSEAIEKFENDYQIKFPEKYRAFLLKYNGGNTLQTSFSIKRQSSDIRAFYGFNKAHDYYNFQHLIDKDFLQDYLDLHYLPIAEDSFGNYILLGLAKKNYNQIAFFDHEGQKVKPLKVNFEEFLDKIKSKKKKIRTIEERIAVTQQFEDPIEIDDELLAYWQEEIDRYAGREQLIVKL